MSYLGVLRELIRFCDGSLRGASESHVLTVVLANAWPVLNDISSQTSCRTNEAVLSGLLGVHSQLLAVAPALIGPYFNDLVNFVVTAYKESSCPSVFGYVSAAVESFETVESIAGLDENRKELIFTQLLAHLCHCAFTYVTQTKRPSDCPHLIRALFEMAHRYLPFCPGALRSCSEFGSLFALAVACITECKGVVESTRADLIFLTQLIGWRHIHLQESKLSKLMQFAGVIDNLLTQHGGDIQVLSWRSIGRRSPDFVAIVLGVCLLRHAAHRIKQSGR